MVVCLFVTKKQASRTVIKYSTCDTNLLLGWRFNICIVGFLCSVILGRDWLTDCTKIAGITIMWYIMLWICAHWILLCDLGFTCTIKLRKSHLKWPSFTWFKILTTGYCMNFHRKMFFNLACLPILVLHFLVTAKMRLNLVDQKYGFVHF